MKTTPTITREQLREITEQGIQEFAVSGPLAAEVRDAAKTIEHFQLGGFGARQCHTCLIGEVRKRRGLSGPDLIPVPSVSSGIPRSSLARTSISASGALPAFPTPTRVASTR